MKAAFLAVIILLAMGGLYVWVTTPILPASTHPVESFSASSSGSVWWVGASSTDSSALPNTGVRGAIQVISMSVVGCLAFWVSDDLSDSIWGQVGYYICNTSTPLAFYQIWNLNTNAVLTTGTTFVSTGSHTFSMYLQSGTTWAYSLDGTVFGTYDMGASVSSLTYPVYALSEEEANSTFSFPSVTFSTALQVMKSGSWNPVQTANSYGTGWGVVGAAQGTGLQADQITVGGSLGVLPQGTQLWSAGTVSTTSTIKLHVHQLDCDTPACDFDGHEHGDLDRHFHCDVNDREDNDVDRDLSHHHGVNGHDHTDLDWYDDLHFYGYIAPDNHHSDCHDDVNGDFPYDCVNPNDDPDFHRHGDLYLHSHSAPDDELPIRLRGLQILRR